VGVSKSATFKNENMSLGIRKRYKLKAILFIKNSINHVYNTLAVLHSGQYH